MEKQESRMSIGGTLTNTHNEKIHKQFEALAQRSSINTGSPKPQFELGHTVDHSLEYGNKVERMIKGSIASDRRLRKER